MSSGLQYTAISLKPDVGGAQLGPPIQFAFMREALRLFHGVSNYYLSLRTFPTKWKGAMSGDPKPVVALLQIRSIADKQVTDACQLAQHPASPP